jgi:hypothetical protein
MHVPNLNDQWNLPPDVLEISRPLFQHTADDATRAALCQGSSKLEAKRNFDNAWIRSARHLPIGSGSK